MSTTWFQANKSKLRLSTFSFLFLDISNQDQNLVEFHQRQLGYCLTGETDARKFFCEYGPGGSNGKTTKWKIVEKILGPLQVPAAMGVLIASQKQNNTATPELSALKGVRVTTLSETDDQVHLAGSQIKALTGNGDTISIRQLYEKQTQFVPTCKPVLLTNNMPLFDTSDPAICNRIMLVPYDVQFEQNKQNDEYCKSLFTEHLDELFSWMVEGSIEWYKTGKLVEAEVSVERKKLIIAEQDPFAKFIQEKCILDADQKILRMDFYIAYKSWCNTNLIKPETNQKFSRYVQHLPSVNVKNITNTNKLGPKQQWHYVGITAKDCDDQKNRDRIFL